MQDAMTIYRPSLQEVLTLITGLKTFKLCLLHLTPTQLSSHYVNVLTLTDQRSMRKVFSHSTAQYAVLMEYSAAVKPSIHDTQSREQSWLEIFPKLSTKKLPNHDLCPTLMNCF